MSKELVTSLKYLNYATIYSAQGDIDVQLDTQACFADILNRGTIHNEHYELYLLRDPKGITDYHYANICIFTEQELKRHILLARRLIPFTFSVEQSGYDGLASYKVNLDISANHFYHRYLLTWIRYAYEIPYNLFLADVHRLKQEYLKKESITNLFVLCANSYNNSPKDYEYIHAIPKKNCRFLKEYELKAKINSFGECTQDRHYVNELYSTHDLHLETLPQTENESYLEWWLNEEAFQERAQVYLRNYKRLIDK